MTPGDFIDSSVKCCADFESALISEIRWLVFAQSGKEGAIAIISRQMDRFLGTKHVRFAWILKLVYIRLHHVKERKKVRLEHLVGGSRTIGFIEL